MMGKIGETIDQTVEGIYEGLVHGTSIAFGTNKETEANLPAQARINHKFLISPSPSPSICFSFYFYF